MKLVIRNCPAKLAGGQETSRPCPLGGSGDRATRTWSNRRCLHDCFASADYVANCHSRKKHRRAAIRGHVGGEGPGVLLRRHLGGTAEPAREDSAVAGDGAHLVVLVQGQGDCDPGDRAHAARGARAGRLGAQGGQLGTDHGAVDQGRHRHAPVVADLRPQARRHLRDPGRDRGRRGQAAQGHAARRGTEGTHDRSRGVRALSAGRPARTAVHRRGVQAVRRALPQGAGDRSALRPGVGRAGPQLRQRDGQGPAAQQGGVSPKPARRR